MESTKFSRRDMLKKGAVAGAVFWAIPVIETVPAYAATGSYQGKKAGSIGCSWAYVVYIVPGHTSVYVAGYQSGSSQQNVCTNYADTAGLQMTTLSVTCSTPSTSSTTFTLPPKVKGAGAVTYYGGLGGTPSSPESGTQPTDCNMYLKQSGNMIIPQGGAIIQAYFWFTGGGSGGPGAQCGTGGSIALPVGCTDPG
ncbi:MAG: hypothetical protein ACRDYY_17510 [Acidimicrobiales bacterium]